MKKYQGHTYTVNPVFNLLEYRQRTVMDEGTHYEENTHIDYNDRVIDTIYPSQTIEAQLLREVRLQWKDVDVKGKTIVLWRTKTRNGTTLMMTERLHQVMKRRFDNKRNATWVFPGISGPAISSGARIRKAIKRAGLKDFRLHDIRHSFASKLVQQGCTLYEVAALLGHSSPNTSARYSHLEKKSVAEKAANVLNDLNKR